MFRPGVFTSRASCTMRDRELETAINAKLPRGQVAAFTVKDDYSEIYGLTFSYRGLSKTFMRKSFDLDIADLVDGLSITSESMQNVRLPAGWVDDEDEAAEMPNWVKDLEDGF